MIIAFFGFGQDPYQRILIQLVKRYHYRHTSHKLRNHTELDEILRQRFFQHFAYVVLLLLAELGIETNALAVQT